MLLATYHSVVVRSNVNDVVDGLSQAEPTVDLSS